MYIDVPSSSLATSVWISAGASACFHLSPSSNRLSLLLLLSWKCSRNFFAYRGRDGTYLMTISSTYKYVLFGLLQYNCLHASNCVAKCTMYEAGTCVKFEERRLPGLQKNFLFQQIHAHPWKYQLLHVYMHCVCVCVCVCVISLIFTCESSAVLRLGHLRPVMWTLWLMKFSVSRTRDTNSEEAKSSRRPALARMLRTFTQRAWTRSHDEHMISWHSERSLWHSIALMISRLSSIL